MNDRKAFFISLFISQGFFIYIYVSSNFTYFISFLLFKALITPLFRKKLWKSSRFSAIFFFCLQGFWSFVNDLCRSLKFFQSFQKFSKIFIKIFQRFSKIWHDRKNWMLMIFMRLLHIFALKTLFYLIIFIILFFFVPTILFILMILFIFMICVVCFDFSFVCSVRSKCF